MLMDLDEDKALNHDGFPFWFIQIFWELFTDDMINLFKSFYTSIEFDKKFSKSMISLIPKTQGPNSINDF